METITAVSVVFYLLFVALYILLIVIFIRAALATIETRNQMRDMSFRDTARYISEVRRGIVTEEDQAEAKEAFGIK